MKSNVILTVCTVLVSLLVFEIALRVIDGKEIFVLKNYVEERTSLIKVQTFAQFDEELGWTPKANLAAAGTDREGKRATFTTDAYGNRMPSDKSRPLPKNAAVAVGDSFTNGSEVTDSLSWPAQLEGMIGLPVTNASGGGWGTDQIVLSGMRMLDLAEPKLLLVSFFWQDLMRSEYRIYAGGQKPYFLIEDGKLVRYNDPVPRYSARPNEVGLVRAFLGYSYLVAWFMQRAGYEQWLVSHDLMYVRSSPENSGVEISCLLLRDLKQETEARGVNLIFLVQYASNDFGGDKPDERGQALVDCGREIGIETVDAWPPMKAIYDRDRQEFDELFVLQADGKSRGHMSGAGNALMAELLFDRLQATNMLVPFSAD